MKITNKKAISLVVLVIIIIVMIMLVGVVVINLANTDIINKSNDLVDSVEIKSEKEIIKQARAIAYGSAYAGRVTVEDYERAFAKVAGAGIVKIEENMDMSVVIFNNSNRYYEVNRSGEITGPITKVTIEYAGDITKRGTCTGSTTNPYQINCIEDLVAFSIMSNGGNTSLGLGSSNFGGKYVMLMRTLDFESLFSYEDHTTTKYGDLNTDGIIEDLRTELTKTDVGCIGFKPITGFYGTFDGQEQMIKNVYMKNTQSSKGLAFFRDGTPTIKNLSISGTIINTAWEAAGIVSIRNRSTIINCKNYADITGYNMVGGISTYCSNSTIKNCYNYGDITITGGTYQYTGAGGISAHMENNGIIQNCVNEGTISGNSNLAGILGVAGSGTILDCVNKGKSTAGIICWAIGDNNFNISIINSYNIGECIHGLVNYFGGANWQSTLEFNIYNSYNLGPVTGAGLVGSMGTICKTITLNIENCYNVGTSSKAILGSIGTNSATTTTINVKNTYYDKAKSTGAGAVTEGIQALNETDIKNSTVFVQTLNNNIGSNTTWKSWKIGSDGYPTFQ